MSNLRYRLYRLLVRISYYKSRILYGFGNPDNSPMLYKYAEKARFLEK